LNSMIASPAVVSDTFLAMYLSQISESGALIFAIRGEFEQTLLDSDVLDNPSAHRQSNSGLTLGSADDMDEGLRKAMAASMGDEDDEMKRVLAASLRDDVDVKRALDASLGDDDDMKKVLAESMSAVEKEEAGILRQAVEDSIDQLRGQQSGSSSRSQGIDEGGDDLERAIAMSYETGVPEKREREEGKELTQEEMRAKRIAAFGTPDRKGKGRAE
jgi:hypothetical protein